MTEMSKTVTTTCPHCDHVETLEVIFDAMNRSLILCQNCCELYLLYEDGSTEKLEMLEVEDK